MIILKLVGTKSKDYGEGGGLNFKEETKWREGITASDTIISMQLPVNY